MKKNLPHDVVVNLLSLFPSPISKSSSSSSSTASLWFCVRWNKKDFWYYEMCEQVDVETLIDVVLLLIFLPFSSFVYFFLRFTLASTTTRRSCNAFSLMNSFSTSSYSFCFDSRFLSASSSHILVIRWLSMVEGKGTKKNVEKCWEWKNPIIYKNDLKDHVYDYNKDRWEQVNTWNNLSKSNQKCNMK